MTEVALDPEFLKIRKILAQVELQLYMGPFNNYVDKMGGRAGVKSVWFCPRSWYENCPRRGREVKKGQNSVHLVIE